METLDLLFTSLFPLFLAYGLWTLNLAPQMGLKGQFVNSIWVTGPESLPTESSCRSGNCARILVYKLSESGNTTFSIYHHDDVS
jgi:hypothetical protein